MQAFLRKIADPRPSLCGAQLEELHLKYVKDCRQCGGTGRIYSSVWDTENNLFKTIPCSCARFFGQMADLLVAGVSPGAAAEVISERILERNVVEYDIAANKTLEPSALFKDHLWPYMASVDKVTDRGYSFLFIGTNSTGKTFIAQKILRRWLRQCRTGHYIKFRQLMKLINSSMGGNPNKRDGKELLLNTIAGVDLLVIDELGKETGKQEHISGEIEQLLKDRDSGRRPTIVITNNDWEDLADIYSVHIIGAFTRNYRVLIFNPNSNMRIHARLPWDL